MLGEGRRWSGEPQQMDFWSFPWEFKSSPTGWDPICPEQTPYPKDVWQESIFPELLSPLAENELCSAASEGVVWRVPPLPNPLLCCWD